MPDDRHDHPAYDDDAIEISSRLAHPPPFRPHAVATSCAGQLVNPVR